MADLQFTLDQVTSLAEKVSKVENLSTTERDLLLAIFAAAAARAKVIDEEAGTSTLPVAEVSSQARKPSDDVTPEILKRQLLNAYIPGNYFQAAVSPQDKIKKDRVDRTTG